MPPRRCEMENPFQPRFRRDELVLLVVLFSAALIVTTGIHMGDVLFPPLSRLFNVPVSTATLLVSVWAWSGLLAPLFGPLSDRYGHGMFVLAGMGLFTLGNLLCAVAPSFPALVVFQILVGLGYAIFSFSAFAIVGDVFAYGTRARAVGIMRFAVSVAALVGVPAAAAIAAAGTARAPFAVVGGLGIIMLGAVLLGLPLRRRAEILEQPADTEPGSWRTALAILRQRPAFIGLLAFMAWVTIPTGVFIYLAAWLEAQFAFLEAEIGVIFSILGLGSFIGNALTAAYTDRLGKKRSAILGLLVLSMAVVALARLSNVVLMLVCLTVLVAALEFGSAAFITLMTELAPSGRGTLMSLVSLVNGIGTGAVPLLMLSVWQREGYAAVTLVLGMVGLGTAILIGGWVTEGPMTGAVTREPPGPPLMQTAAARADARTQGDP